MLAAAPYRYQFHSGINDEAIVIQAARRMLEGQMPYRDFDLFYTPGSMVLTAGWLGLFGPGIEVARWLVVLCFGAIVAFIFLVSQRVLSAPLSVVPPILFCVSGFSEWPILSYHWFAILGLLACVHQLLVWQVDGRALRLMLSGVSCGLAGACLQSEGLASFLAAMFVLTMSGGPGRWAEKARSCLVFLAGVLSVWVPFLLLLWLTGSLVPFIDDTILRVLSGLYNSHAAPYDLNKHVLGNWRMIVGQWPAEWNGPRLVWAADSLTSACIWTLKYGLLFPVIAGSAWLGFRRRGAVATIAVFLVLWTFVVRERLDLLYSNYLMPLWYVALVLCLSRLLEYRKRVGQIAIGGLCLLYAFGLLFALRYNAGFVFPARTSAGVLWSRDPGEARAVTELYSVANKLTPPGSRTFAWPFAASFYVLSQTVNPTRLDFLVSGWQSEAQVESVVRDLSSVDYIYLFPLDPAALSDYPNINPDVFHKESLKYQSLLTEDFEPVALAGAATVFHRRTPSVGQKNMERPEVP